MSSRLSVTIPEGLANGLPLAACFLLFVFCYVILLNRAGLPVPACHFAVLLDFEEVLDGSCGSDVKAELVPELDDNPGTTRSTKGTKFSALH